MIVCKQIKRKISSLPVAVASQNRACLRTVPTNSKVFLRGLLNMREKQILTSVIEIQKENWG